MEGIIAARAVTLNGILLRESQNRAKRFVLIRRDMVMGEISNSPTKKDGYVSIPLPWNGTALELIEKVTQ
jgi:hypothetical protein